MRAALLFILFFLAHVGRSPAEAYSSGPGSCSALSGHGAGSYTSDSGYWKLEHDGGSSVNPNDRVVVRLYDLNVGAYPFKGFIFKTSAGTLTVKDAMQTKTVSACAGAIGHTSPADKSEVEAYLDMPSTTGTVTVTVEIVQSKMQVSLLTLDIACSDAGDAAEGGGSQSPSPSTPAPSAQDKKKQAETTRDSILGDISDARVKAKAKLLADAAIAGVKVQKLSAKITAADEDTACSETFSKAGMSAGDGACVATAASSGKRRRLSAMAYDVELMFSASTVNDDALKAAELELKNNGVEGVTSQTSVDPIAELKTVPGVDTNKLQTFETEASAAATAAEAQTPPPPTPPPPPKPNLVLDDDDGTVGLVGRAGLLMATAFAILAILVTACACRRAWRPTSASCELPS